MLGGGGPSLDRFDAVWRDAGLDDAFLRFGRDQFEVHQLLAEGEVAEAIESGREAITRTEARFGSRFKGLSALIRSVAVILFRQGRGAEAVPLLDRRLEIVHRNGLAEQERDRARGSRHRAPSCCYI